MKSIRIGTRGSALALAQANQAGQAIARAQAGWSFELVPICTRGDRQAGPLADVGGKGLFTAELEAALCEGQLDLAVHSAKDLPAEMAADVVIAAVLPRADVRDALISRSGGLDALPAGAKVGTSSLRRSALLRSARPDVEIAHLRGNVDTRIRRVLGEQADFDATILAMAGLARGGWLEKLGVNVHPLPADSFLPAAGQGTLVLQTRADAAELIAALQAVNHSETFQSLQAERSVLKRLGANCHSCLAVYVHPAPVGWRARAMVACPDGSDMLRVEAHSTTPRQAADALADTLLASGAKDRMGRE